MFNNKVIDNLYTKINDYRFFYSSILMKKAVTYALILSISLLFIVIYFDSLLKHESLMGQLFTGISVILALFSGINLHCLTNDKIQSYNFLWKKSGNLLNKQQQEIIEYISNDMVQIEILNFDFKSIHKETINELKKFLALKEYDNAYKALYEILNTLNELEQQQLTESQTKKLISEYELNLKMKL